MMDEMRTPTESRSIFVCLAAAVLVGFLSLPVRADSPGDYRQTFPKIAGLNINGSSPWKDPAYREDTSKLHLVIMGMWRGYSTTDIVTGESLSMAEVIADVRQRAAQNGNANILIAKYTNNIQAPSSDTDSAKIDLRNKLFAENGPGGDWWGRNSGGGHTSTYGNTYHTNITRFVTPDANGDTYAQWIAQRNHNEFFASGSFDAVFMDLFNYRPTASDIDWDGNGSNDSRNDEEVQRWFRQGMIDTLQRYRDLAPGINVIGNVSGHSVQNVGMLSDPEYQGQVVGLIEALIGLDWSEETWGGWSGMMKKYQTTIRNSRHGVAIFSAIGDLDDYATMRYGFASCLMDDGYFQYNKNYKESPWYDEYDLDLGGAVDAPQTSAWKQGVFMRRFENGMAIVNPKGNGTQVLTIPSGYKRISGTQDPNVNNGQPVATVTLPARDGIILQSTETTVIVKPNPPTFSSN